MPGKAASREVEPLGVPGIEPVGVLSPRSPSCSGRTSSIPAWPVPGMIPDEGVVGEPRAPEPTLGIRPDAGDAGDVGVIGLVGETGETGDDLYMFCRVDRTGADARRVVEVSDRDPGGACGWVGCESEGWRTLCQKDLTGRRSASLLCVSRNGHECQPECPGCPLAYILVPGHSPSSNASGGIGKGTDLCSFGGAC